MFANLSAGELGAGYARGDFTPVEVAESLLARIAALDGPVNSMVFTDAAATLASAAQSAARYARRSRRWTACR
jgi:aspartyl-tRNA(Asn)/glutamyl-tRNA(Gln) amidotransferase subunit A